MKIAERVLCAIKMECSRQTKLAEISCFEKIATRAAVPPTVLCVYLEELQEKGYIKYSALERFIYLTKEGKEYVA